MTHQKIEVTEFPTEEKGNAQAIFTLLKAFKALTLPITNGPQQIDV